MYFKCTEQRSVHRVCATQSCGLIRKGPYGVFYTKEQWTPQVFLYSNWTPQRIFFSEKGKIAQQKQDPTTKIRKVRVGKYPHLNRELITKEDNRVPDWVKVPSRKVCTKQKRAIAKKLEYKQNRDN